MIYHQFLPNLHFLNRQNLQNYNEQNRIQYFADILILIGLVLISAIVFSLLGALISSALFHIQISDLMDVLSSTTETTNVGFLKFYNAFAAFGAWVVSAFLLSKIRSYKINSFWKFQMPKVRFIWVLLPVLFISAVVVSAFLLNLNERLPIPSSIRNFFNSANSAQMLERMLQMNNHQDLFINIVCIALFPALFEEIFFRGTLQPLLSGLFKNHHIGIWICSLIFALVHLNIDQVIPMMFLALVLGYLFYYTKSIYTNILIHFLNNSLAVFAYYYQNNSEIAKQVVEDKFEPNTLSFFIFLGIVVSIFVFIIQQHKLNHKHE
jgi:membrane protease YdiL (CAAX protease family)